MTDRLLFDDLYREPLAAPATAIPVPGAPSEDKERLAGQCAAILDRLKAGPATTIELARLSLKYSSRIAELRHDRWIIEAKRKNGGTFVYTLKGRKPTN